MSFIHNRIAARGFTLVEMALALVIVALLLGGMLLPLTMQAEQSKVAATAQALEEIKEALIGYAISYGKLPCPTSSGDPAAADYGIADAACSAPGAEGYVPWKTLGVAETDAWGSKRSRAADPWLGYWRYRVDRNFAANFTLATSATLLQVKDAAGNLLISTGEPPVAIIFSAGKNLTADGQNASFETAAPAIYQSDTPRVGYDDMTTWITRHILLHRMVAAGKLP